MRKTTVGTVLLSAAIILALSFTAQAAKRNASQSSQFDKTSAIRAMAYSFPDERGQSGIAVSSVKGRIPLGVSVYNKSIGSVSPGITIGDTWYEYQHNGTVGRMVEWGPYGGYTGEPMVHFSWMQMPSSEGILRKYYYNVYYTGSGALGGTAGLQPDDEFGGYVNIDVTPDNRAVVGGHNKIKKTTQSQFYWDFGPGFYYWSDSRIPDDVASWGQAPNAADECVWPKFTYQYGPDTVIHVTAQINEPLEVPLQAIYYFRKVGLDAGGVWDTPPYVIDSVADVSNDVTCDRMGSKVALVWIAQLNYQELDCDTCSGVSPYLLDDYLLGQMDNDVYYQISNDQGVTWQPRVNLTKIEPRTEALKAYCDLSSLIDSDGQLHILWPAIPWPEDPYLNFSWEGTDTMDYYQVRLQHWSEAFDDPVNPHPWIRTVVDHTTYWSTDSCYPPAWATTIAKPAISECDGKLYAIWAQFNDVPRGVIDDCAAWVFGIPLEDIDARSGSTNGDIWFSVSADNGVTWDPQRNLTNSYSKGCDPNEGVPCQSDHFPSAPRFGRANEPGEDWSGAEIVDPTGSYGGSPNDGQYYFLDIQYINDPDAGGAVMGEGTWQMASVNWFRLPCVEPVFVVPPPHLSWHEIGYPAYTPPGVGLDTPLTIANYGNTDIVYSLVIEEDNGPAGWLTVSGFSGVVPAGFDNSETGMVHLNTGGMYSGPTTFLVGRLLFTSTYSGETDTIPINLLVTAEVEPIVYDTVSTGCISLTVANNGNMGHGGIGGVNLDWHDYGDCDSTAKIYLYDGSPIVGWIDGTDTIVNSTIWSANYVGEQGLVQIEGYHPASLCEGVEVFESGTFVSHDSSLAFERIWFAPTEDAENCDFVIEYLRMWSFDRQEHTGIFVGEGMDWDIPDDSGNAFNTGGISPTKKLVYQIGAEYLQDDTIYPYNCQYNDARFGGVAFIGSFYNGVPSGRADPFCAFVERNDSLSGISGGFDAGSLYEAVSTPGYRTTDVSEDLHAVMCYEFGFTLGASDTYEAFTVLATVQNGTSGDIEDAVDRGRAWFVANGGYEISDLCGEPPCCEGPRRGNIDALGEFPYDIDIADLVYLVNYMFVMGPEPPCPEEADVNGDGEQDIADLVCLVNYMFPSIGTDPCEPAVCP